MSVLGKVLLATVTSFISVSVVLAQSDCPAIVRSALDATGQACDAVGRNQACYGNVNLEAEAAEGLPAFPFDNPGDLADLVKIRTLRLSSLDTVGGSWGIAMMKVQANLPATLPGQNVTFVLFGDVNIENGVSSPDVLVVSATAKNQVNVRSGPSTSAAIVGSLSNGESVSVDGRNAGEDWLHVQLGNGEAGWVFANLVTIDGEITSLAVIDAAQPARTEPEFGPMQAFYFRSGAHDAPCVQAPDSGILVQSPQGAARVHLQVNAVEIELGSTIFLQAQAGGSMTVTVIEGSAVVGASGVSRYVPAGSAVSIPLDNNLIAAGAPGELEVYAEAQVSALPISLLQDAITLAQPLTETELAAAKNPQPVSGEWQYVLASAGAEQCRLPPNTTGTLAAIFTFEDEGRTLVSGSADGEATRWTQIEPGKYSRETPLGAITLTTISPTLYVQQGENSDGCPYKITYTLVQSG